MEKLGCLLVWQRSFLFPRWDFSSGVRVPEAHSHTKLSRWPQTLMLWIQRMKFMDRRVDLERTSCYRLMGGNLRERRWSSCGAGQISEVGPAALPIEGLCKAQERRGRGREMAQPANIQGLSQFLSCRHGQIPRRVLMWGREIKKNRVPLWYLYFWPKQNQRHLGLSISRIRQGQNCPQGPCF